MNKDFNTADLFRIVGLGRRPKPEDLKYGRFNRRMMAATIDSLALIMALPLLEPLFRIFFGDSPVNMQELYAQVQIQPTPEEAGRLYWGTLIESGYLRYWAANTLFQFGFLAFLSFLCWLRWSATPGKMIMRLKIVDAKTEGKPSVLQFIVRALGYFISGIPFGLGFFWICFNKRRQGWHDILSDTMVVTVPWGPFKHARPLAETTQASQAADRSGSPEP